MTRTGTSHFITFEAALRYYREQTPGIWGDELTRYVASKVAEGEIHLGEPPIKPGEHRELIDNKTRYAIVSP